MTRRTRPFNPEFDHPPDIQRFVDYQRRQYIAHHYVDGLRPLVSGIYTSGRIGFLVAAIAVAGISVMAAILAVAGMLSDGSGTASEIVILIGAVIASVFVAVAARQASRNDRSGRSSRSSRSIQSSRSSRSTQPRRSTPPTPSRLSRRSRRSHQR